ncbi:hypothetical protein ACFQ0D_31390, partial [Micromonospora zhanjiangensis]
MSKKFLGKMIAGAALGGASLLVFAPGAALADGGPHHQGQEGAIFTKPKAVKPGHEAAIYQICDDPQEHATAWSEVTGKVKLKPKKDDYRDYRKSDRGDRGDEDRGDKDRSDKDRGDEGRTPQWFGGSMGQPLEGYDLGGTAASSGLTDPAPGGEGKKDEKGKDDSKKHEKDKKHEKGKKDEKGRDDSKKHEKSDEEESTSAQDEEMGAWKNKKDHESDEELGRWENKKDHEADEEESPEHGDHRGGHSWGGHESAGENSGVHDHGWHGPQGGSQGGPQGGSQGGPQGGSQGGP